jgi:hypothetical protein
MSRADEGDTNDVCSSNANIDNTKRHSSINIRSDLRNSYFEDVPDWFPHDGYLLKKPAGVGRGETPKHVLVEITITLTLNHENMLK